MSRLFFVVAFALAGCAGPNSPDAPSEPRFALASDMSCNADQARVCHVDGCPAGAEGEEWLVPISLHVPRNGGAGRYCIATGCEDAQVEVTQSAGADWTATVRTNDRTSTNAALTIRRDGSFTFRDAGEDGVSTWAGRCEPAGS